MLSSGWENHYARGFKMPRSIVGPERQYWVWVTKPEYYTEDDGSAREGLDPSVQSEPGAWWSCHRDTKCGDLVLLYRTKPRMDFGYLIRAESDAYSISDDANAYEQGWDYGCEYQVLHHFQEPLTRNNLRADPYVEDWRALRGNFQGRAYRVPQHIWTHLQHRMEALDPDYSRFVKSGEGNSAASKILLEEELEQKIVDDPTLLGPLGYDLEIRERQVVCTGHGGRIDLLCYDRKCKRYVVVELKNVRAGQNTFGQIATYLGWVDQRLPLRRRAKGLVIARGFDNRFLTAVHMTDRVQYVEIGQLGLE